MKKTISLFSFIAIISLSAMASNTNNNKLLTDPQVQIKKDETVKKKPTKYDFSLFKFISPASNQKKDTTNKQEPNPVNKLKDETTYENPLDFFKFSYAS